MGKFFSSNESDEFSEKLYSLALFFIIMIFSLIGSFLIFLIGPVAFRPSSEFASSEFSFGSLTFLFLIFIGFPKLISCLSSFCIFEEALAFFSIFEIPLFFSEFFGLSIKKKLINSYQVYTIFLKSTVRSI